MRKLDKFVLWLERAIIMSAFIVMVAITFANVVARYLFDNPISWSEEVARFLFVWITMMGAAQAIAYSKHFCVDFLICRLSLELRRKIACGVSVCVIAFAAIMLGYGGYVANFTKFQVSPAILLPMTYPYLCIPLSGLFIIIHALNHLRGGMAAPSEQGGSAE